MSGQPSRLYQFVLIETYWNVKMEQLLESTEDEEVLIETYWNVK